MNRFDRVNNVKELTHLDDFFEYISPSNACEIYIKHDATSNLRAVIAIHSTKKGPALGGCRFIAYHSPFAAVMDAIKLARAMSYKAALINIPFGGGKAVLLKPENFDSLNREAYFKSFGKFISTLEGRYITAVDSGTKMEDMDIIATETNYVASTSKMNGSPSPYTALGVLCGIKAAVLNLLHRDNLKDLTVAIQGVGEVGYTLAKLLVKEGATIYVSDVNQQNLNNIKKELDVKIVEPDEIWKLDVDIFSPCALGGIINETTIPMIRAKIIAGAANNQLKHVSDGETLHARGILYAPDYVINAGGLIYAAGRYRGYEKDELSKTVQNIYNTLIEIFDRTKVEKLPPSTIAEQMAKERLYGKA